MIIVYKKTILTFSDTEVEWDELDYLLIDSPPGTSDEHMGIVTLMADAGIDGGIIGRISR